jgi:hypothetical protein
LVLMQEIVGRKRTAESLGQSLSSIPRPRKTTKINMHVFSKNPGKRAVLAGCQNDRKPRADKMAFFGVDPKKVPPC